MSKAITNQTNNEALASLAAWEATPKTITLTNAQAHELAFFIMSTKDYRLAQKQELENNALEYNDPRNRKIAAETAKCCDEREEHLQEILQVLMN